MTVEKVNIGALLEKFKNMKVSIRSLTTYRHVQQRSYIAKGESDILKKWVLQISWISGMLERK